MTNPDRVAFTLFGRDIYWYGILMAMGILMAIWLADKEERRKLMPKDTILDACLYMIPCGIVCARLYYVLFEWRYYIQNPIEVFYVWQGGLAFYGSLLGGILGLWIYCRRKKASILPILDSVAPGLVLAQAIGRWGNFFNQEAFGLPVNNGSLIWFPIAVRIDGIHYFNGQICNNPYHLATFFYESVWCLIVFIFLWTNRKKFKHDGDAFLLYALLYGFERMFVEGLRGDSLYLIQPGSFIGGGIRVSQLGSFLAVVLIAAFFIIRHKKEKELGRLIWPSPKIQEEDCEAAQEESTDGIEKTAAQECGAQPSQEETSDNETHEIGEDQPEPFEEAPATDEDSQDDVEE